MKHIDDDKYLKSLDGPDFVSTPEHPSVLDQVKVARAERDSRVISRTDMMNCPACEGLGIRILPWNHEISSCNECYGDGVVPICPHCGGATVPVYDLHGHQRMDRLVNRCLNHCVGSQKEAYWKIKATYDYQLFLYRCDLKDAGNTENVEHPSEFLPVSSDIKCRIKKKPNGATPFLNVYTSDYMRTRLNQWYCDYGFLTWDEFFTYWANTWKDCDDLPKPEFLFCKDWNATLTYCQSSHDWISPIVGLIRIPWELYRPEIKAA